MLWIKEVEMAGSLDEVKSSRSMYGKHFPKFEMLDAKIASALNKIIQNSQFKKKNQSGGAESPKRGSVSEGDKSPFMIYDNFRVTGAHDVVLDYADLFSVTLRDHNIQEFDARWDEVLSSMTQIPSDDILGSLYTLRIRESDQLKKRIGIVRHGDSSEDIGSQISEVEKHGAKEYRSETSLTKR